MQGAYFIQLAKGPARIDSLLRFRAWRGGLSGTLDRYIRVAKDVGRMVKGSDKIDMLDLMRDMAKLSNARTGMSDTLTDAVFNTARFAGDEYRLDNMDDLREYIGKTLFDRRLKNRGKFLE